MLSGKNRLIHLDKLEYEVKGDRHEVYRFSVDNRSGDSLEKVLYLHDFQEVLLTLIYPNGKDSLLEQAGILTPPAARRMYRGLVIPGYGYSTQLQLVLPSGRSECQLEVRSMVPRAVKPELKLYSPLEWSEIKGEDFEEKIGLHLLVVGGMLVMALYHLLVFVQRRDWAFFWYALYAVAIGIVLMIESGIFQIYITPFLPKLNFLYRHLQPHALFGYSMYWLFLRSFVKLPKLLPWLDKLILRFLAGFTIASFLLWIIYTYNAFGEHYSDLVWVTYALPVAALVFGIWSYFPLIRTGDRLVQIFVLGSFILLLGVSINTLISAGIEFGFLNELSFPHFLITEVSVIIEILFFALALGYRFQRMDFEKKRMAALDSLKSKFFANISHEFRTPLTIISGLAGQLKGNKEEAVLIQRNSNNLLALVNRMLDLSKLDAGQLKMEYIRGDIIAFLRYLTESFYSLAESKSVRLSFHANTEHLIMDFDEMRLQQIVSNLVSNAIKFTPENGAVTFEVDRDQDELIMSVTGDGIGISKEDQQRVFDRFFQAENAQSGHASSGIGLALTRELVELAGGEIAVSSTQGKGSTFRFSLPIKVSAEYAEKELPIFVQAEKAAKTRKLIHPISHADKPELLIIEDNRDITHYLEKLLAEQYSLSFAEDGQKGIDKALAQLPDIIISDVMMPEKDGYEVCHALKNDPKTSHIPIVLLTAKAAQEDKLQGLRQGADAYLMKPFDPEELFVRLEKLLALRRLLQERFSNYIPETKATQAPSLEEQFLNTLSGCVEARLDDSDLKISDLEEAASMSNMQLYRKLKALTGLSPTLFIRSVRLQKAKAMLEKGELNVSEVAYETGFSDPAYFSRVFKEAFGSSPVDFRKMM
jgi:signal transduction histidine kinase/CheY-like chemotaxis protein